MAPSDDVPAGTKPSTPKPTLVLLHGWGYDNTCWPKAMLQQLQVSYDLVLLDLPGHGQDTYAVDNRNSIEQLDEWITATKRLLPSQYHLMGWSLGAQIAIRMAHNDRSIQRVTLMAVNPKFMSSDKWPAAMSPELLSRFEQGYETQTSKTLRRFASLQAQGSENPKLLAAQMIQLMHIQPQKIFGLHLLQELDERTHLRQLPQPCYIELAQGDELVPSDWVDHILLPNNMQIHYIAGGHGYLLEQDGINTTMAKFIDVGLVMMPSSNFLPDVQQVAQAFSQAAATYDEVAGLQRIAADLLLKKGANLHQGKVLDIGSGTGYVSAQLADVEAVTSVTGLDIAEGMLTYAKSRHHNSKLNWHLGDAQQLPLTLLDSAKGYDLIISSLAIQWCKNLDAVFSGVAHCLTEDGVFHCATLGPKTLHQLKWAWSQVDDYQHVNEFVALELLRNTLENYFVEVEVVCESIELKYLSVQHLTKDLKQLGASNHNAHAAQGLMGVGRLRKMVQAYESLRDDEGQLPVTYEVYYIKAKTRVAI